jgi:flagellin-like protein
MVKKFKKRGLSPVITTVLLIALVVVSTSIVFLWFRGMVEEGVTKFGKNIKLVCDDVGFEADYNSGTISIVNNGNIPIFRVNLRISSGGNFETKDITEISGGENWPDAGLAQGGAFSGSINVEDADTVTVLPVLIGTSSSGQKTYICGGEYGKELTV